MPAQPPPDGIPPQRLRIVGVSGSGKSHLAQAVAARMGLPRLDLDAVFWDAGWTYRDLDEAHHIIREFVTEHPDGWVSDGGWVNRLDSLLDPGTPNGADTFVWLDHPRHTVMRRVILRTLRRAVTREELWHSNRENPLTWLRWDPHRNIIRWAWVNHAVTRHRMRVLISEEVPVIRLCGQREVNRWLASLPVRPVDRDDTCP